MGQRGSLDGVNSPLTSHIRDSTEGVTQRENSTEGVELRLRGVPINSPGPNCFLQVYFTDIKDSDSIDATLESRQLHFTEQVQQQFRNRHSFFYVILELQVYT